MAEDEDFHRATPPESAMEMRLPHPLPPSRWEGEVTPVEGNSLFDLLGARPLKIERERPSAALQVGIRALVAALVCAALYGAAVGCTDPRQVLHNVVAVPLVVLLSLACAAPVGLVMWKIVGEGTKSVDLVLSVVTGVFSGAIALGAAAPLLALYYLTTEYVGAPLALGIVALATTGGVVNAFRAGHRRRRKGVPAGAVFWPLATMLTGLLLAELQLIHLAAPILPEDTVFDHGVEGFLP